ncbi:hybrid sensor histidine kinase/response regulator [Luteolibacter arcticus]|uniref:histidine kinase n=1 Tax=Luteolibacter arcticus TaxID=1581411 RepID=A0ABT3GJF8_9BACT|nr:hybrid sensor histidine kinase/response regulator [Luteolibacter arcticus]MCW1923634.1 hybrid sensor histidine kinase/response regulator [Luteolibacter arcticus]
MSDFDPLPPPSGPALILVVDDEPRNIQVVGPLLLKQGHEVIAAGSGEEALAKMRTAKPDLLLLDVMMPGMTGFDLCRRLLSQPEWHGLPVIFLSAVTDKSFVTEALAAGAVDYVTKPFHGPELLSRVQLHLNLRQMRLRLSAAVEERNHLLEIVAHDLKNPLGGVMFAAAMLEEEAGSLSLQQARLVDSISQSAARALEITASLLQTQRLEEAKSHLELTSLCLRDYAVQAMEALSQQAANKEIEVTLECAAETIPVRADRRSLLCSLENLVSNSIKFSPPGSRVCVRLTSEGSDGVFRIEDQGPGVREDERSKLFRKFTRLSARPTGNELSTGLGLHIVHELVKAMGGDVYYEDAANGGACFVVSLPLAR